MRRIVVGFFVFVFILTLILISYQDSEDVKSTRKHQQPIHRQILQTNLTDINAFEYQLQLPTKQFDTVNVENIPQIYTNSDLKKPSDYNKTCAKYPDLLNLRWEADHWQKQKTFNGTFSLFGAYLDDRASNKQNPIIRIVGLYNILFPNNTFYCQIWLEGNTKPVIAPTEILIRMWVKGWGGDRDGVHNPYLISCPLPENIKDEIPVSVSLVEQPCDNATNNLKVIYDKIPEEEIQNFVVCVKGLNFPYTDQSIRLVEWIELLNILGADKIQFYQFSVHPNVEKVLDYYKEEGFVEVTPLTLVGDVSNHPYFQDKFLHKKITERRLQEVIPYNDCLYKNLYKYRYVVLLDTDEVIVPLNGTWVDLIERLQKIKFAMSYMARNVYFLDSHQHNHEWFEDIPEHMHMLQHVVRAYNYTRPGQFVKGFHDTQFVLTLHNHFPFKCNGGCKSQSIDLDLAHLQHYRGDCVKGVKNCEDMRKNSVLDTRVWNFKDELVARTTRTLLDLGFLKKNY